MKYFPPWTATLRRAALALGVAATIAAAAYVEEDWRGERALRRFAADCAAEGMPLDYAFYRPAPVPDSQNLFRDPFIARFFDPNDTTGKNWGAYEGNRLLPWDIWKTFGQWQRGRPTDFAAAYRILERTPPSSPDPDPKAAAALVLARINVIKPDLDSLREAARQRPRSQIEFLTDGRFVPNSFGVLRVLPTALSWRASAEIELGRYDDAFGDIFASFRLAEGAATFPSQLHLLFANVIAVRATQPFWEGYSKGVWTEAQLETMQDLLSRLHPLRELPAARAAFRAAVVQDSDFMRPRWMPRGWWKLNMVRLFKLFDIGSDQSSFDPRLERVDLAKYEEARAFVRAQGGTFSPFTYLVRHSPWPDKIIANVASAQTCFALAETACAVGRYKSVHGEYPRTLGELVPRFLPSVPHDVIDGKPLRYGRTEGGGFRLYSVGLNGIDDHGALPGPTRVSGYPWTSTEGDWAWPQPASG